MKKPKSTPKKNSRLGHLRFIYDQYGKRDIVDETERYVRQISGYVEIFIGDEHDDAHEWKQERGTVAGRFDASHFYVDNILVDGMKLYGVMNTCSAETAEIYETLFHPQTDKIREDVKKILGDVTYWNILVIDRVEILPAYRNMRLGLATLWNLIQRHSAGCGIVALKAFPYQFRPGGWSRSLGDLEESDWNKKMAYNPNRYTIEFAHEKLMFHLLKLGFKRIGNTGVMALSTSSQYPIPQEIRRWVP